MRRLRLSPPASSLPIFISPVTTPPWRVYSLSFLHYLIPVSPSPRADKRRGDEKECQGSRGERRKEEDACSRCREAVFLLLLSDDLSAGSYLWHYILSGAKADCARSCPSVSIAQVWFPWQHLQRRMLGFQALWPWVNNWLVTSEKPRTFSKAVYSPSHQTYRKQVK